jgi:hypothetical protein
MVFEPTLRVFEGEDGALLLAPVRRPCCLELFGYQEIPFSRGESSLANGVDRETEPGAAIPPMNGPT